MTPFAPIFGYTMADLQNMGLTALLYRTSAPDLNTPPVSSVQQPAAETETLTPEPNLNAPAPCCSVLSAPSVFKSPAVKVRKPRSKISRLPKDIQHNLNAMLASGCPYRDIIRNLIDHGYPGFNKVNLHTWKLTGFQGWLRTQQANPSLETDQPILETGSNP